MKIAVGCDHAGFPLKAPIVAQLQAAGHQVVDCGAMDDRPSDYPDCALAVARQVAGGQVERGVLICGSGVGATVAANKVVGVRACLCHDTFSARQGVEDDDMNVICLGARIIGPSLAAEALNAFLAARFSHAERHARRLGKVLDIERQSLAGGK